MGFAVLRTKSSLQQSEWLKKVAQEKERIDWIIANMQKRQIKLNTEIEIMVSKQDEQKTQKE